MSVPSGAVFTDTQLTKSDIDALGVDAGTVDGKTVAVNVPSGAVFTDTQLTKSDIDALGVDAGTVDGKTVAVNVPSGAVFTDTQLTKSDIDALGVDAGTVDGKTVAVNVPSGAVFTDTQLTKSDIDALGVDAGTVDGKTVAVNVPSGALFTDTQLNIGTGSGDALAGDTDVVTKTGTETLTNKTFTSPTVNGAIIDSTTTIDVGAIPTISSSKISDLEISSLKADINASSTKVVTGAAIFDQYGSSGGGASELDDLSDVLIGSTPAVGSLLQFDQASSKFKPTKTLGHLTSITCQAFIGVFASDDLTNPTYKIDSVIETIGGANYKQGRISTLHDLIIQLDASNQTSDTRMFRIQNGAGNIVFSVDENGRIGSGKFSDTSGNDKIEYEASTVKIVDDIKSVTGKFKDNSDVTRIDYSGTTTKISGDVQYTGSSPATISGPDADKLNIESVDDIDFKIASGGASAKSFKFYNNTTEIASLASNGELQIGGDLVAGRKIQLGSSSDTTIERTAAGTVTIEGKEIVTVNKVLQQFNLSFTDDIGTTQHYLSWRDQYETSSSSSFDIVDTNYLVPANGRVKCVYMRVGSRTATSTLTVRVYSQNAGFMQNPVEGESEASSITSSDDFEVFAFYFDDAEHFQAGDSIKISVQDSVDSGFTQVYHVTAVLEFDYTQMGRTDTGELA